MIYTLKVEWDDGEKLIEIGESKDEQAVITDAEVFLDTIDDTTRNKSKAMLAKINVKGQIIGKKIPKLKDSLLDIFNWARDFEVDSTYRKVTLTIKEDAATVLRTYEIQNMFVRDYKETYQNSDQKGGQGDKGGMFELALTQQENDLKKILVL